MSFSDGNKQPLSNSILTNPQDERKRVALVTFAVLSGAASYIILVFIAMPLSVHLLVNVNELGCNVANPEEQCFAATSESQSRITLILTLLRLMTFLFGSTVGLLSDRYGRRPLLILALGGYAVAAAFFLLGWITETVALFLIGGIILGASSPITPHGVAYVSDISKPGPTLSKNLGIIQGFGYFMGLMTGALISLLIASQTTGKDTEGENGILTYNQLFYASYGTGFAFSLAACLVSVVFLKESLHASDRSPTVDFKKGNPFSFIYIVSRTKYFFFIWLCAFFAWMAVGAAEAVSGGWWLRRYTITDITQFYYFILALWAASGFGSVFMTPLYVRLVGLKGSIHLSAMLTIVFGVAFSLAPTVQISYVTILFSFFAAPIYPATLAVLTGQVDCTEKGALSGALRSSEALGKIIGIVVFGQLFSSYIANFRPDSSCIPGTFNPNGDQSNTCECGVESCPIWNGTAFTFVPSNCTLGMLSPQVLGKFSATIEWKPEFATLTSAGKAAMGFPFPNVLIANQIFNRSDVDSDTSATCKGSGLLPNTEGFVKEQNRLWCATGTPLGCGAFNFNKVFLDANTLECSKGGPRCNPALPNGTLGSTSEDFLIFKNILSNRRDEKNDIEVCPSLGTTDLNLCLAGPIGSFPGSIPFAYLAGLGCISYIFYLIAELLFVSQDKRLWADDKNGDVSPASDEVAEN